MIVDGQVHGGISQGLGQALMEECVHDRETGQLLTGSFMDYAMPRADNFSDFDLSYNEVLCKTSPIASKVMANPARRGRVRPS
jgi:carbon-monoxide dehydrogenase large subunit